MTKILTAALLTGMTLLAASPAKAQSTILDLTPSGWNEWNWNHNFVPLNTDANGGLYLDIPTSPVVCPTCDTMDYLFTHNVPTSIEGAMWIVTLTVETTGTPVFHYRGEPDCPGNPPSVRPFFWAHNDNFQDGARWWANDAWYELRAGSEPATMVIPLDPAHFRGVKGEMANESSQTLHKWESALNDISSIGVTFGGGCNFGHGIYVTGGTARFTLRYYEIRQAPLCPNVTPCALPCQRGTETGGWSLQSPACLNSDGTFTVCSNSQSLRVVNTTCNTPACCKPPCISCPPSCGSGTYLQCQ